MIQSSKSLSARRRLLPAAPAILLAAVYLTFLIDLQTLETSMQRIFIFCYFVVMGALACFLKGKYAEGKPFPLQSRIAAALLAALLVGAGWNTFLPHVRFPLEGSHMYALWEKLLYTLGAWCVVFYLAQLALLFLARPMEKRGWTERQKALAFLLMGNFVFLFFTSDRIQPTHPTQGFLLLLTVASVWCFNRKSGCMEKYRTKGYRAAIGIIAVYASLASFAQRFFLDGNTRMHFSLPGLFYVLSGILWFIPVIRLLLFALEWLSSRPRTLPKPGSRKKALCVLLAALVLCQIFVLWAEWPGGFALDSVYQYRQAMGELPLSDDHPVLDTLLMRAVLTIIPHPAALTAAQLLLFSLVLCAFLMMGYDRGVPLPLLVILGCFFELMPNQALSWTNVLKDFPFTLALLWGTYLLLQLALDTPRSRKWPFYVCLALDIFLVSLLRHNGAAPAAAMALLCIVLTVRRYAQVKLRALTAAVLAAVSVLGVVRRIQGAGHDRAQRCAGIALAVHDAFLRRRLVREQGSAALGGSRRDFGKSTPARGLARLLRPLLRPRFLLLSASGGERSLYADVGDDAGDPPGLRRGSVQISGCNTQGPHRRVRHSLGCGAAGGQLQREDLLSCVRLGLDVAVC